MGILVTKQPEFVHGVHDVAKAAAACYGGGACRRLRLLPASCMHLPT